MRGDGSAKALDCSMIRTLGLSSSIVGDELDVISDRRPRRLSPIWRTFKKGTLRRSGCGYLVQVSAQAGRDEMPHSFAHHSEFLQPFTFNVTTLVSSIHQ